MKGLREMDAVISPGMIAFEGFRFDVGLRRLLRLDSKGFWSPVTVGSRALDILGVLLRQPGVLVTKDTIMRQVWPGIAVEANNLTVQITALRKVLDGNCASESCIQTVSGRGYRFVAPVMRPSTESVGGSPEQIVGHPKLPSGSVMPARLWGLRVPEGHERPVQGFIPSDLLPNPGVLIATGPAEPKPLCLVAPSAERRQLTAMACDVADLGMLSGRLDLEDLCEVTTACHRYCMDIIERYHGHVANYAADGVLAYFGYPQADEHDAERAIRAGLALIEAVPELTTATGVPLRVGVGIATGMVVTGGQVGPALPERSLRWAARPILPRVCKHWPVPTRLSSLPRPVD
jgi:DNA-binding winged helix-turn-helix (wHTH) protein